MVSRLEAQQQQQQQQQQHSKHSSSKLDECRAWRAAVLGVLLLCLLLAWRVPSPAGGTARTSPARTASATRDVGT